jgi:hypothetical protein
MFYLDNLLIKDDTSFIKKSMMLQFNFCDAFITGSASGWGRCDDAAVVKVSIIFSRKC